MVSMKILKENVGILPINTPPFPNNKIAHFSIT